MEEYRERRMVGQLGGVLLDDVCWCSQRDWYCQAARDRGTGAELAGILATGIVGP